MSGTRAHEPSGPARVVVLGSANVDHVLAVGRLPGPGETVLAGEETWGPGGKGLNQAVASARAGSATAFIGAVGDDDGGRLLREALSANGVSLDWLRTVPEPTGEATVVVDRHGENLIVVARRANGALTGLTESDREVIGSARVLLCQLEVPAETVAAAGRWARAQQTPFILNAAPAQDVPGELIALADILVVNETEAAQVLAGTGRAAKAGAGDPVAGLRELAGAVVVTRGARGAEYAGPDGSGVTVAAPQVSAVDTTGAGDTFCGVLAAALADGLTPDAALRRAVAAGAWSVQSPGTTAAMPTAAQLDDWCARLAEGAKPA